MATPDTWICVLPCAVCADDAQLGPRSATARAGQPYGPPHKDNFLLQHYHLLVECGAARRTNLLLATLVGINAPMTRNALPSKSCRPCIKEKVVDTHCSSHQGKLGSPPRSVASGQQHRGVWHGPMRALGVGAQASAWCAQVSLPQPASFAVHAYGERWARAWDACRRTHLVPVDMGQYVYTDVGLQSCPKLIQCMMFSIKNHARALVLPLYLEIEALAQQAGGSSGRPGCATDALTWDWLTTVRHPEERRARGRNSNLGRAHGGGGR